MPRIRQVARRTRAAHAPHIASHNTSFRHPVHSDLLWKHRDSHTSLLSNWHIVPRLPRFLTFKLAHCPTPATWLNYCELPLGYSTTWLNYCELPLGYSPTWLNHRELPLGYSTTWLNYCELPLGYSTTWLSLLWATSWLLYHLTKLSTCSQLRKFLTKLALTNRLVSNTYIQHAVKLVYKLSNVPC